MYSNNNDLLRKCATGIGEINSALERFLCVVAWSISAVRPLAFGVTPFNPILGETHHVSNANLNVLLEQVCLFTFFLITALCVYLHVDYVCASLLSFS